MPGLGLGLHLAGGVQEDLAAADGGDQKALGSALAIQAPEGISDLEALDFEGVVQLLGGQFRRSRAGA